MAAAVAAVPSEVNFLHPFHPAQKEKTETKDDEGVSEKNKNGGSKAAVAVVMAGLEASEGAGLGGTMVGEEVVPIKGSEAANVSTKNNIGASPVEKKHKNDLGGSLVLNEKKNSRFHYY